MILFVPNTAMQGDGAKHSLPRPDFNFLNELSMKGVRFKVIGFEVEKDDPFMDSALESIPCLEAARIGTHTGHASRRRKVLHICPA